ncbi:MAG: chorismate-binding protein [Prosthecobacter sp.]|nr:chorismate-binding protein [Prosthecobacter sp.]
MTELAFFRLPGGRAWIGQGPFESLASAPDGGGAFYVNDFDLSDPRPWKKPARLTEVTAANLADLTGSNGAEAPHITWAKPATEWFKMAFRRIRREVLAKRLEKMVPVLTERGEIISGSPLRLLDRVFAAPDNTWGYAFIQGDNGFLGATPELLFRATGADVETMALAGTAKPGDQQAFLTDVKEIEEHEIVVRYLIDRLSRLGQVERDPRNLCHASGLLHFQTNIHARLDSAMDPNTLVKELHPTPAVGCLPREEQWLAKLHEYRTLLNVPAFFGAPFGFLENGTGTCHMVVSIRGLSWQRHKVQLPSGCGIVGGSAFDHEWRELRLKREAVLGMLGL